MSRDELNYCCIPLTLTHVTGGYDKRDYSDDILEFNEGDGWRNLQKMKHGRNWHGISLVDFNNFEEYCT